ncbi:hypothetical protein EVA_18699 [gut metagenome]|uniref:Uncharacterized protein n=1 Tax=gut metagenome TaxID=749906 RepID=J9G0V3_9ZZZZ
MCTYPLKAESEAVDETPTSAAFTATDFCGPIHIISSMSTSLPKMISSPLSKSRTAAKAGSSIPQ